MRSFKRRDFIRTTLGLSLSAILPAATRESFAQERSNDDLTIESVDVLRVTGEMPSRGGMNRQYQTQPLHLYDLPEEYHDDPSVPVGTYTGQHDYVRIRTRSGLEGLYGYCDSDAAVNIVGPLKRQLIGKNAMAVEMLWDRMYRADRMGRAGRYMKGISYLDCALWDLRGRHLGVPVFQLLGGPTRDYATAYGSCLGYSIEPDKAAQKALALKNAGFLHQKWFPAYGPAQGNDGLSKNVQLVAALRDALGPSVNLMFDSYQSWDLQYASKWCRAVEQFDPTWLEEAFPTADLESFIQLSQRTAVPLATGEHFFNRWEVAQFLKANAIQYVQADPEWCGGVSELVKICHLASVHGAKVVPHGHNIHAALHVVLSQSPAVCPLVEYLLVHVDNKVHFQKDPPITTNGRLELPTTPGFGIELDRDKIDSIDEISA